MNTNRLRNGKYTSGRFRRGLAKTLLFGFVLIVIIALTKDTFEKREFIRENMGEAIQKVENVITPTVSADLNTKAKVEKKIEELENKVIARIRSIESNGAEHKDGEMLFTFDPSRAVIEKCRKVGGWMNLDCLSLGIMQMKVSTIQRWQKQLTGEELTEREAFDLALDDDRAVEFAKDVIVGIEGAVWEWSATHGDEAFYNEVVPLIRELKAIIEE